jgi:2-haloacid dehalogenase
MYLIDGNVFWFFNRERRCKKEINNNFMNPLFLSKKTPVNCIFAPEFHKKIMHRIKNIVFDFGGVLIDWNPELLYKKVFKTREEMDFFLSEIATTEWNTQQDAGRSLSEATAVLQEQYPEYHDEIGLFYSRWAEMLGGIFEENVRLIKPLKGKYRVFGLTNWSAETLPVARAQYDFFDDLDGIVVSGEEKCIKPDKQLFRILLDRFQIRPEESLFIDDNEKNIRAAQEMGFQTLHLTPAVNLEKTLKEMDVLD